MNVFVGELPPPYGGVAIKDKLLYKEIYESADVKFLDLMECKRRPLILPFIALRLIWYMAVAEHVIIGVGSVGRHKILLMMRKLLRGTRGLSSTHVISMGGRLHSLVKNDKILSVLNKLCGGVWVETEGIKIGLEEQGFKNIRIFPNCRSGENVCEPKPVEQKIKYVYFSRICQEKGMDEIMQAVDACNGSWSLDLYGEVSTEYKSRFEEFIAKHPEVKYHGVFDSTNGNVYQELNKYDAMLLPSKWKGEGVPGTLVESKMAGIAAIVSEWNFNAEVVINEAEGIVLHRDLALELNEMTAEKMEKFKWGAYESRARYDIITYEDELLEILG